MEDMIQKVTEEVTHMEGMIQKAMVEEEEDLILKVLEIQSDLNEMILNENESVY